MGISFFPISVNPNSYIVYSEKRKDKEVETKTSNLVYASSPLPLEGEG